MNTSHFFLLWGNMRIIPGDSNMGPLQSDSYLFQQTKASSAVCVLTPVYDQDTALREDRCIMHMLIVGCRYWEGRVLCMDSAVWVWVGGFPFLCRYYFDEVCRQENETAFLLPGQKQNPVPCFPTPGPVQNTLWHFTRQTPAATVYWLPLLQRTPFNLWVSSTELQRLLPFLHSFSLLCELFPCG